MLNNKEKALIQIHVVTFTRFAFTENIKKKPKHMKKKIKVEPESKWLLKISLQESRTIWFPCMLFPVDRLYCSPALAL